MAENFDRAPGAGRGRGRGGSVLSGASESGGGACPGGGGSHGSGAVEQQQNKTSGLLPQQEPLRPPRTAPLGTGSSGTGPPRRATGLRRGSRRRRCRGDSPAAGRARPSFPSLRDRASLAPRPGPAGRTARPEMRACVPRPVLLAGPGQRRTGLGREGAWSLRFSAPVAFLRCGPLPGEGRNAAAQP